MSKSKVERGKHVNPRAARSVTPADHSAKQVAKKAADSLVCEDCGVVQHGGRWHWGAPAIGFVRGGVCPACKCIRERRPMGTLRIPMPLVDSTNEVMEFVRSAGSAEQAEHPLERLMDVVERDGELWITTTGAHLVRRLVTQLRHRFRSKPKIHYDEDGAANATWPPAARSAASRGKKSPTRGRRGGKRPKAGRKSAS